MKKPFHALFPLLLALVLAGLLAPAALAASRPASVRITTDAYVGTPEQLREAQADAILDMAEGKTLSLSARVSPSDASQQVRWSSSNRKIAAVSSSGLVTARARGTVTIEARSRSDASCRASFVLKIVNSELPETITLNAASLKLYRFDSFQLRPTLLPETASKRGVAYKSSRSSVAAVSKSGLITAKKAGTATITCYSTADKSVLATVAVTVSQKASPTSITLTPADTGLVVGNTLQLTAAPYPSTACNYFTFKSSNTRVATVDERGLVTAKKTGKVKITVTSRQNTRIKVTRTLAVVSPDSPLSIQPESSELTLTTGSTHALAAAALPADKSQQFLYKSSKSSVLTVSKSGLLTAKKAGTATVTITSAVNSDVSAQVTVRVKDLPAPSSLTITPAANTLAVGGTLQLSCVPSPAGASAQVTWKSSSSKVASISSSGLVTARQPGVVTLTATSRQSKKVTASLRVVVFHPDAPTSISLPLSALPLETSQTYELTPTLSPAKAKGGVTWRSSNSRVVSVSAKGVLSARSAGSATVTVTSNYNPNVSASVRVTVTKKAAPSALSASLSANTLMVGETASLTVAPVPSTASRLYTYSSSASGVASVSSTGVVTAKKAGKATITVASKKKSSVKASFQVTVYTDDTPKSLALSSSSLFLTEDGCGQLTASILPASAYQKASWSSSNSKVASVSSTGLVTAQSSGQAVITCRTAKGDLTAQCTVQVLGTTRSTVIPARTTDIAGIPENLAKIDALRKSAVNQVAALKRAGTITAGEASLRNQIINRAFAMQSFPWMTLKTQEYWSRAYASKRYLPGYVYYGLPYIQTAASGSYLNRRYDAARALSEKRYTDSGSGYYMLNQKNLLEGMYCGNDCSSFVSMSQWGTSHPASYYNTVSMAKSSYYKTLSGYSSLRPGDFLLKSGDHTVLFLYFTTSDKSKMMVIEQGGNGNTIICSEYSTSHFKNKGYKAYTRAG